MFSNRYKSIQQATLTSKFNSTEVLLKEHEFKDEKSVGPAKDGATNISMDNLKYAYLQLVKTSKKKKEKEAKAKLKAKLNGAEKGTIGFKAPLGGDTAAPPRSSTALENKSRAKTAVGKDGGKQIKRRVSNSNSNSDIAADLSSGDSKGKNDSLDNVLNALVTRMDYVPAVPAPAPAPAPANSVTAPTVSDLSMCISLVRQCQVDVNTATDDDTLETAEMCLEVAKLELNCLRQEIKAASSARVPGR